MCLMPRDNPDDSQPLAITGCLDAFADRVTGWPVTTRQCFIDNCDEGRVAVLGILKVAPLQKRNAQRLKGSGATLCN